MKCPKCGTEKVDIIGKKVYCLEGCEKHWDRYKIFGKCPDFEDKDCTIECVAFEVGLGKRNKFEIDDVTGDWYVRSSGEIPLQVIYFCSKNDFVINSTEDIELLPEYENINDLREMQTIESKEEIINILDGEDEN